MFSIKQLSFRYQDKLIFKNAQVEFNDTSLVCIHGKSGCGKTTLLKILLLDLRVDSGIVQYHDEILNEENYQDFLFNHITYVDQEGSCFHNMTLYQHFEFYAKLHGLLLKDEIIQKYLQWVHLENIDLKKYPSYLSTGQRKRFMIAMALMIGKNIILIDEPTASLDNENKDQLIKVLKDISKKCLVICTSHDQSLLENADEVYKIINHEIIVEKKTTTINQLGIHQTNPMKVKYFKYKNLKMKFLFMSVLILSLLISFFVPFLTCLNINLTEAVSEQQKSDESTGLIFYKSSDARGMMFGSSYADFPSSSEMNTISEVTGVKSVNPYYCILDGKERGNAYSMQLVSTDREKQDIKYYWPKYSQKFGIDYYANVAIMSYSPEQNIAINGKKINGIYIDENFQQIVAKPIQGGEQLSLNFSLPVGYELYSNERYGKKWNSKVEEYELSFQLDGVMPDHVYADEHSESNFTSNYIRIYMPVDKVQSLLGQYAVSEKHIYNNPMEYLVMCEEGKKDIVKMNIEKINELYQVTYQVEGVQYSQNNQFSSQYMILFMCGTAILGFVVLSYYQLYSRNSEVSILNHEGLNKEIKKYFMKDYWLVAILSIIISLVSFGIFIHTFQFQEIDIISLSLYWFFMIGIIVMFILIIGYHGIYMVTKRKSL